MCSAFHGESWLVLSIGQQEAVSSGEAGPALGKQLLCGDREIMWEDTQVRLSFRIPQTGTSTLVDRTPQAMCWCPGMIVHGVRVLLLEFTLWDNWITRKAKVGMVTHACNSGPLRGQRQEDCHSF